MATNTPNSKLTPLTRESILIIDDEETILSSLAAVLNNVGYQVETKASAQEAIILLNSQIFDILIVDLKMPTIDGLEFLQQIRPLGLPSTIIVMSAYGNTELALQAIQFGATDYIAKPFNPEELLFTIRKARERERLKSENELLKEQVTKRYSFSNIIAKCAQMMEIFETIKKISEYNTTILIQGESGTGKELVARAIHYNSPRKNHKFVAINCGAIPENLLESELFGHKRGAFTDATKDKKGLIEEADHGTILLDEIGELPLHLQVKLLRVLQERVIYPVGDSQPIPVNVRVIAATLRDLEMDVQNGRFRDDLLYRLNVITVSIPPLRERKEDIPLLVNYFLKKNQEKLGLAVYGITTEAMNAIIEYNWPGNIRELENCVERAMILTDENKINLKSLPRAVQESISKKEEAIKVEDGELSIKKHTSNLEKSLIVKALKQTRGNRTHAAKLLEISHRTLLYKLKEYNIADDSQKD